MNERRDGDAFRGTKAQFLAAYLYPQSWSADYSGSRTEEGEQIGTFGVGIEWEPQAREVYPHLTLVPLTPSADEPMVLAEEG